jgi:hypothetical protein
MSTSPTPTVRRSVTEKKKILADWQQSTLAMKEFCHERDISLSGLKTWIKQFGIGRKRHPRKKASAQFISIVPDRPLPINSPFAELQLPSGIRLAINQPVTADFLRELIDAAR